MKTRAVTLREDLRAMIPTNDMYHEDDVKRRRQPRTGQPWHRAERNGPHCNGADKAALRLAQLGRLVKKMIGGVEGWKVEGFPLVASSPAR